MQTDIRYLLWSAAALFLSYLAVAMPLPLISTFVIREWALSAGLGGLAVGIPFVSTILARGYAGRFSDRRGGKACMTRGLSIYILASAFCAMAVGLDFPSPGPAYALLLAGRLLLGLGESLVLVGMLSWNISLLGAHRSGIVFSTVGMIIYGAIAAGAPLGFMLTERAGFAVLMLLCLPLPLLGLGMIRTMPSPLTLPGHNKKESFLRMLGTVWRQGAVVGFQGVGFAALGAFIVLYFASKGWPHAGFGMTCFGLGFVLVRLGCGHLPDRFGGKKVALISLTVEACGQFLLWQAWSYEAALTGAFFTGAGCSMVYPSMGVEVIRRVSPELRGTAIGGFSVFQDIAYAATAPLAGICADHLGYGVVFILGLTAALLGLLTAFTLGTVKMKTGP